MDHSNVHSMLDPGNTHGEKYYPHTISSGVGSYIWIEKKIEAR